MPTENVRQFSRGALDGQSLTRIHPDCGCENTEPHSGGHGAVADDESLVFFAESKAHYNINEKTPNDIEAWRPSAKIIRRAFDGTGFSVYRRALASPVELRQGAEAAHAHATAGKANKAKGVFGVVEITAADARIRPANQDIGRICILDTPQIYQDEGKENELSHADLLWSKAGDESAERPALQRVMEDFVGLQFKNRTRLIRTQEFDDVDLSDLQPQAMTE